MYGMLNGWINVRVDGCMDVCVCVCMYGWNVNGCMEVCMYVCIYGCMYVGRVDGLMNG